MALIFTDREIEGRCELLPSRFAQKRENPFYRWGPLVFRCCDSMKDGTLAKEFDKVDFGIDTADLHVYMCAAIEYDRTGRVVSITYDRMQRCCFLLPFICRYLRDGEYIAIHMGDDGWDSHYHPTIDISVSQNGIRNLQSGLLDMDAMFIFRREGGTYEFLARIFDEMCCGTSVREGWRTWTVPKDRMTAGELLERIGSDFRDIVAVRPFDPERDGEPVNGQTEVGETITADEARDLGQIDGYHLWFFMHPYDPDTYRKMNPELYIRPSAAYMKTD
ncbi:hypothetical protein AUQ37_05335 [Candidatus Methanomethylophilus sp. 1R26]|uniref:hypothetical protein n=1 Tax=Candidatus Methanomethylophilus sp. 1R26 TaxID=1769296 RepID=UPI0007370177|nr:hypothetical protein [Candidatus Methanomethylophilus sp. 1R26]KUE74214.1 hypothetical protein AUQ37_05335 [Candidatus Methanomethylophilus sp. 1R26]